MYLCPEHNKYFDVHNTLHTTRQAHTKAITPQPDDSRREGRETHGDRFALPVFMTAATPYIHCTNKEPVSSFRRQEKIEQTNEKMADSNFEKKHHPFGGRKKRR